MSTKCLSTAPGQGANKSDQTRTPSGEVSSPGGETPAWKASTLLPHRPGTHTQVQRPDAEAEGGPPRCGRGRRRSEAVTHLRGPASRPQAPLQVGRGQVTAPVRPTPPAASPRPVLRLHHLGRIGTSSESRGVPLGPTCARPAPDARVPAATALRHSGRAGGGPAPALRRLPAAAGSAGSPGAGRLAASDRLHCDAAPSAGQSRRRGANR